MRSEKRSGAVLGGLFSRGIELLGRTTRLELENADKLHNGVLAGYWHGDSCGMMLLMRELSERGISTAAVVTADSRGDVISRVLERYGAGAVRMRDGVAARRSMAMLMRSLEEAEHPFALALDGPTGPLHKPKRLILRLAERSGREMVFVSFDYGAAIRLRRWDRYAVPLPFSRVVIRVEEMSGLARDDQKVV